ncbi:MAG: HAMP domain-containing sensor histidine kinase [Candidatus Omnitrophota bacterium]
MRKNRIIQYLGIVFFIAVIVPCVVLSSIAVRAISHEEAFIEKQIEKNLIAEVTHVASLIEQQIILSQQELTATVAIDRLQEPEKYLKTWKDKSPLVSVPFLISPAQEILWPRYGKDLSEEERIFLDWNRGFIADEVRVPVYENIAVVYKEKILKDAQSIALSAAPSSAQVIQGQVVTQSDISKAQQEDKEIKGLENLDQQRSNRIIATQQAISEFQQNAPLRAEVYQQAEQTGKQVEYRVVDLNKKRQAKNKNEYRDKLQREQSIFIAEPQKFSQIIDQTSEGIVPRFIEDKLRLLFWKRIQDDYIVGCVISQTVLNEKILGVLPNIYTPVRILTVINEHGRPLVTPVEKKERDWKKPITAREIGSFLPRWEVTAYLTDPDIVSAKARLTENIIWILIFIMVVSVLTGGTLILRSLHSQMILAQQKSTFVANVSHELKTPLTSIKMFAEMLMQKRQPDEQKKQTYLSLMASEAERLSRLINNVLDFSRRSEGKKRYNIKQVNIVSLCREIIESQRPRIEHNGFKLSLTAEKEQIFISADEEAIKQVILNLLSNAEKYSMDKKEIECKVFTHGREVFVNIEDRGIGVAKQDAKLIFKEFYRVDDSLTACVRGTGLGLSISQKIIQDHRGNILYFAREEGGSIFQIRLPQEEVKEGEAEDTDC